jgi:hypothetical protein
MCVHNPHKSENRNFFGKSNHGFLVKSTIFIHFSIFVLWFSHDFMVFLWFSHDFPMLFPWEPRAAFPSQVRRVPGTSGIASPSVGACEVGRAGERGSGAAIDAVLAETWSQGEPVKPIDSHCFPILFG